MKKIILPGGTGFLGTALARELIARDYEVVILTRRQCRLSDTELARVRHVPWDAKTLGPWARELEGAEAVVNFTGRNVNCRYDARNRRAILESRVDSVRVLNEAILACAAPPKTFVQAATLAILGDAGDEPKDDAAPPGVGFSPDVAKAWERAFYETPTPGTRKVLLRISFALAANGGALRTLAALTRCFLGGTVGRGSQYVSWVHLADLCRVIVWAIENHRAAGTYNATAPNPVTNATFMRELRRALRRPWSPPAPAWAVRLGCVILRTEPELALWGRRGIPKRLLEEGFTFRFTDVRAALEEAYGTRTAHRGAAGERGDPFAALMGSGVNRGGSRGSTASSSPGPPPC
jgi:uncharacterized protein (TIGR01777 family)